VILYKQYKEEGPSSPQTNLDDGLRLIEYYKERIIELNKKKEELVLAEKLFNLDISSFPELVAIDEENKNLQPLYDLYREVKNTIKDYSSTLWVKLDAEQLQKVFDKLFNTLKRKLSQKYSGNVVYNQLYEKILAFKNSIPLIIQLKNGSITDRHWEKLLRQTGNVFEVSIKTMTLDQVFSLNLQKYEEIVFEIVN
jgi:dynein heavy chain